jgi:hypothetical protein
MAMLFDMNRAVIGTTIFVVLAAPVWADDCTQPMAALMITAKTPYSETIVFPGPDGKMLTSHLVQTATSKYVERNGNWTSMPISSADLVDTLNDEFKTAKLNCRRTGTEQVNGQQTTIYTVHMEIGGRVTDGTLWISAQNRQMKSDTTVNGSRFTATFDYEHVQPPAGAKPLGQR